MKKLIISMVLFAAISGYAAAQTGNTGDQQDVYNDLKDLKKKIVKMKEEMQKFMKEVTADDSDMDAFGSGINVDIVDEGKSLVVTADIPGMDKDKIDITLENNKVLRIAGTREMEQMEQSPNVIRQERMSGSFERVVTLPVEGKPEGITASYKNGVLEVVIPKAPAPEKDTVKINVK